MTVTIEVGGNLAVILVAWAIVFALVGLCLALCLAAAVAEGKRR